jgi:hypothetical protein
LIIFPVVKFKAILSRFGEKGEKTGWTYIQITEEIAQSLKPGNRQSFRVKGKLDNFPIKQVALMPMGDGSFIMPVNAAMRKGLGKRKGAMIIVDIEADHKPLEISKDLLDCLDDDPDAKRFFYGLPLSHRNYFSKWIDSIKSPEGKIGRIADVVNAMSRKMTFPEMLRNRKSSRSNE